MSLFDHFKPKAHPQDPGISPFKVGELVTPAPAVLDPMLVDHKPGHIVDVQHTDNVRDPLGPWLVTIEWPNGWQAIFSAAELTRWDGPDPWATTPVAVVRVEPTPLYDQMKDERATLTVAVDNNVTTPEESILAEHADELATIGDRIEEDLRTLTRRNERRAAVRRGPTS